MTDPYWTGEGVTLHHGDCVKVMSGMPANSIDAIVCDPPYALGFMGKKWDSFAGARDDGARAGAGDKGILPGYGRGGTSEDRVKYRSREAVAFQQFCEAWATEALRILRPGGHLLAFGGTRTWHRLACAVEDAGFEIRDSIAWLYGSGFPKSLDVSKAIDKAAGAERDVIGIRPGGLRPGHQNGSGGNFANNGGGGLPAISDTSPATDAARQWQGWGTALKPAHEPCVFARKPLSVTDFAGRIGSHLERLEREWQALEADLLTQTGVAAGSSARMDTSWYESARTMFWNTVTSWKSCSAELSEQLSTSTTRTTSEQTTALQTLLSSTSSLTPTNMLQPATSPPGLTSIASAVDNLFASVVCGLRATLALSADAPVIDSTQRSPRDAAGVNAFEPIVFARKPLVGTVAANVLAHGTGALNIDGCRIASDDDTARKPALVGEDVPAGFGRGAAMGGNGSPLGRWPANVVLDTDQAAALDKQSGTRNSSGVYQGDGSTHPTGKAVVDFGGTERPGTMYADAGGASRYFFVAQPDEEPEWHGDESTKAASTSAGKRTEGRLGNSRIGGSGNKPTVQSPPDTRSTIGITTHSTTASTTSCVSPQSGTTTITNGSASNTAGSTDKSSGGASGAPLGSDSTVTTSGVPEHGRDTASPVSAQRTVNGSQPTGSTSTHPSGRSRLPVEQLEARFKYTAKASTSERPSQDGIQHATVKPLSLMQYLVRLVTPPGGVVLDPFAGSGTTGEAAVREGFTTILIEREADYLPLIRERFRRPINYLLDFGEGDPA